MTVMTVRHFPSLLGGAIFAAATLLSLSAISTASAQTYTFTTVPPPTVGTTFTGAPQIQVRSTAMDGPIVPSIALTPFFSFNQTSLTNSAFTGTLDLTISAAKDGVAALSTVTSTVTISGNTYDGSGSDPAGVVLTGLNFTTSPFVFNFGDGSVLTLFDFGATNATQAVGVNGAVNGNIGFRQFSVTNPTAPEPGSLALATTGTMFAMGMILRRRKK